MNDRHISLNNVLSAVFWAVGGILIGIAYIGNQAEVAAAGLFVAMLGGCLMIRGYVMELCRHLKHRERNAFELGRDSTVRDFRRH